MTFDINGITITTGSKFEMFDLTANSIDELEIKENSSKDNCFVRSKDGAHYYKSFILDKNTRTHIVCEVSFYKSSDTGKYLPRLNFKKTNTDGSDKPDDYKPVNVNLSDGDKSQRFWSLINFFNGFKSVVDTGNFEKSFAVVSSNLIEILSTLDTPEKIKAIKSLIKAGKFTPDDVQSIVFESRKVTVRYFLWLLKDKVLSTGPTTMRNWYKNKYSVKGDEAIWHHFLKNNDWILGLNVDIRFISELIDEVKVGVENTDGKGSPKADLLGISDYTTLIELKTADTPIFKEVRGSKSRTDTWEFSPDFIAGVSQCLGQKYNFDKSYDIKEVVRDDSSVVSKSDVYNADAKVVFIVGCKHSEFPHNDTIDNKVKSNTFELFRRNNRNVDIITYDELFERAYHMVFSKKIAKDWFEDEKFDINTK